MMPRVKRSLWLSPLMYTMSSAATVTWKGGREGGGRSNRGGGRGRRMKGNFAFTWGGGDEGSKLQSWPSLVPRNGLAASSSLTLTNARDSSTDNERVTHALSAPPAPVPLPHLEQRQRQQHHRRAGDKRLDPRRKAADHVSSDT